MPDRSGPHIRRSTYRPLIAVPRSPAAGRHGQDQGERHRPTRSGLEGRALEVLLRAAHRVEPPFRPATIRSSAVTVGWALTSIPSRRRPAGVNAQSLARPRIRLRTPAATPSSGWATGWPCEPGTVRPSTAIRASRSAARSSIRHRRRTIGTSLAASHVAELHHSSQAWDPAGPRSAGGDGGPSMGSTIESGPVRRWPWARDRVADPRPRQHHDHRERVRAPHGTDAPAVGRTD